MHGHRVGTTAYVKDMVNDLLVVPAGGKLGLAGLAGPVPVATAAAGFAFKNVPSAFGRDLERIKPWAVPGVYGVPAGTILPCIGRPRIGRRPAVVTPIGRLAVGDPERLVALRAGPRLGQLGPRRGSVTGRSARPPMLLRCDVGKPVRSVVVPV
jgi:hypothetical protein